MDSKSTTVAHAEFDPPDRMAETIRCIWVERREFGAEPAGFTILPDGYAEIVFCVGSVALAGAETPLPSPFIMGLLDRPVVLHVQGRMDVLGIRCFPWTVFDLLGLPASGDAVRSFDHPIAQLQPVVAACLQAGRHEAAVDHVRRYLLSIDAPSASDAVLRKAGAALRGSQGDVTVGSVAAAAHASVRTLERRFRRSSGRTVKDVAGAMRFEQVRNRLWTQPDSPLAALAQEFGYTDQAHLSRDFKRYSGATPAAFARKARSARLAAGAHPVAFLQDR